MASEPTKQPQITHSMPTKPGEPVRISVGQGVSRETFWQYLLDNGIVEIVSPVSSQN